VVAEPRRQALDGKMFISRRLQQRPEPKTFRIDNNEMTCQTIPELINQML